MNDLNINIKTKILRFNLLLILILLNLSLFAQEVVNPVVNSNEVEIGVVEHLDDFLPDSISLILLRRSCHFT